MQQPRVIALLIARMTSSRLPGKGLMDISGKPLLWHILARLRRVPCLDQIAVATTCQPEDQPLIDFAEMEGIESFAYDGEVDDVLGRIVSAAENFHADIVVTISGDCPLVDPDFVELLVRGILMSGCELATVDKDTYKCLHEGIGVMTLAAWRKVERASNQPYQREHAGIYVGENPGFLNACCAVPERIFQRDGFRLSVDNLADIQFMRKVYERLYRPGEIIDLKEVVHLLDDEPAIRQINAHVVQKDILHKSKRVAFVLQANESTGMGHLRRCVALALELHESHHCGVRFITNRDNTTLRFLADRGLAFDSVEGSPFRANNMAQVVASAEAFSASAVVLDPDCDIPAKLVQRFEQSRIATVALDDLSPGSRQADLVVLPIAHLSDDAGLDGCRGKIVHGAPYVLLNREFVARRPGRSRPKTSPAQIVVSIGGSDPNGVTGMVIQSLAGFSETQITAVLGPLAAPLQSFHAQTNLTVLHAVTDMAAVLRQAEVAVLGFGITVYEAAHLGTPSLVIAHSEQDVAAALQLEQTGICVSLGHWTTLSGDRIRSAVSNLMNDSARRENMSLLGPALVDGLGVTRVAAEVMAIAGE